MSISRVIRRRTAFGGVGAATVAALALAATALASGPPAAPPAHQGPTTITCRSASIAADGTMHTTDGSGDACQGGGKPTETATVIER